MTPFNAILSISPEIPLGMVILMAAVILLLLIGSAMASASEVSFFSLGPTEKGQIKEIPGRSSEIALSLLEKPKELLAVILIANNFFNLGIIILGAFLSSLLFPVPEHAEVGKYFIDILVITVVILIFGEVIPKIYATKNGKGVALRLAVSVHLFGKLPPFSWFAHLLVRATSRFNNPDDNSPEISSTELTHALELTIEDETDEQDQKILEGIVRFGKKDVRQVMRPREQVEAIEITSNFKQVYKRIVAAGFSRVPVYRGSFDTVIGVLFVKDLLPHLDEKENFDWQKLIREPFFVPEKRKIDDLLKDFQGRNVHIAIVVNEYGQTSGIITLEDVLEEIVGDISDEFDDEELSYSRLDAFNFVFDGKTLLTDMCKVMEVDDKEFETIKTASNTLSAFVIGLAGYLPKKGERLVHNDYQFTVESIGQRKVIRVKVTKLAPGTDENE